MAIFRCLFVGGGFCPGGTNLEKARNILEDRLHTIAGEASKPIRVKHYNDGSKLYECYQLGPAKGMIISGFTDNPDPDFLN
ncbi:hypothetical protein [Vibrio phage vB_ValS_PJ32]|nr:hypothetical protein [Vibrio phage vB_ValS_PJ32]